MGTGDTDTHGGEPGAEPLGSPLNDGVVLAAGTPPRVAAWDGDAERPPEEEAGGTPVAASSTPMAVDEGAGACA
eukprot:13532017-Alexandrium_andersonii.AAC.1